MRDICAVYWWLGCTQEAWAGRSCWGPPCWGAMQAWTLWWCSLGLGRGFFIFLLLLLLPLHSPPLLSWLPATAAPGWWDKGLFLDWEGLEHGGIASVATASF